MDAFPLSFQITTILILGLAMGSFASALIYRLPRGESMWKKATRSRCPSCGHVLGILELIPLFSWLIQRGRCKNCGQAIGITYPLAEILTALLCLGFFFAFKDQSLITTVLLVLAAPILTALFFIDIAHKILPNTLLSALFALGAVRLVFIPLQDWESLFLYPLSAALYGALALCLAVAMEKWKGVKALGMGDVKFFVVAGLWLGLSQIGVFCVLAGLFGVTFGIIWKIIKKEALFPFGPALILAFCVVLSLNGSFFDENTLKYLF